MSDIGRFSDDDLDAMSGYAEPTVTLNDISSKLDLLELKLDRLKTEITTVGVGVLICALFIWLK